MRICADGDGTELQLSRCEGPADVVDREVLLAQGDDLLPAGSGRPGSLAAGRPVAKNERLGSRRNWWTRPRKLPGEYPKRPAASFEESALDEVGAQGLIAAVGGVGGGEEVLGECLFFFFTDKHTSTQLRITAWKLVSGRE